MTSSNIKLPFDTKKIIKTVSYTLCQINIYCNKIPKGCKILKAEGQSR